MYVQRGPTPIGFKKCEVLYDKKNISIFGRHEPRRPSEGTVADNQLVLRYLGLNNLRCPGLQPVFWEAVMCSVLQNTLDDESGFLSGLNLVNC